MLTKTLVLGVGNTVINDEGSNIHLIEYLRQRYPSALPNMIAMLYPIS
jgi:Ni,Fe-hydrogenase maturation factor